MSASPGPSLTDLEELSPLFRSWLRGHAELGRAAQDWQRFLEATNAGTIEASDKITVAPAWQDQDWREPWLAMLLTDLPNPEARDRARSNVDRLVRGEAEVVITGQQPGFLGGPLYTLYKAAATVAAAQARTAAGQLTLPLFWLGDDDDDRQEAFQSHLYDPGRGAMLQAIVPEGGADRMVGAVPAMEWGKGEAAWLDEQSPRSQLSRDLAQLWRDAETLDLSWGRLQRRALLRLFQGTDLLCVSGNDSGLHRAAADFYARLWDARQGLPEVIAKRGDDLIAAGFTAQIGAASLQRWLNQSDGRRRLAWAPDSGNGESDRGAAELPPAERLRPGVAARSMVQDWLFAPAGVVVGPAEVAYLKQLEPLYSRLDLNRSPLLPRLFGRIVPAGYQVDAARSPDSSEDDIVAAAERITQAARSTLVTALEHEAGVTTSLARQEAERLTGRWRNQVRQFLTRQQRHLEGSTDPDAPLWVTPAGKRQERTLATHWATALWGDDLVTLAIEAAAQHFTIGANDQWYDYHLRVEEI